MQGPSQQVVLTIVEAHSAVSASWVFSTSANILERVMAYEEDDASSNLEPSPGVWRSSMQLAHAVLDATLVSDGPSHFVAKAT